MLYLVTTCKLILTEPTVDPNITLLAKVDDNTVKLLCLLDGFVPKKHQEVQWLKNKSPFSGSPVTRTLEVEGKRIFTQISEIHIDAQQLNEYSEYTCQSSQDISSTWSSCKARPLHKPQINVTKPRLAAAKDGSEQITATCSVEAEPNTRVSWVSIGNREMKSDTNRGSKTQLITSTLNLKASEWEKNLNVKCRVKQPCNIIHEETVIILEPVVKTPTVEIKRPLEGDSAVLECSARDLPSGEVSVTFQTNNGQKFPEVTYVDLPKGQSTLITRFTIPTSHRRKEYSFKCKVQQSPSRDWQSSLTGYIFGEPSVELLMIPNKGRTDQTLVCYGTSLNPTITWKPTSVETAKTLMQAADGRVKVSSQINVPQLKWNEGQVYTCQVTDQRKTVEKIISVCTASEPITPRINLSKPRLATAKEGSEQITATCSVEAAPNTKVSWVLNGNLKEGNANPPVDKPGSKTQLITSTLTLKSSEWEKNLKLQCRVKQPCSSEHQETSGVNILESVGKTPTVEIRRPLADVLKGEYTVLECSARDLPSGEVSVTFLTNNGHQFPEVTYVDLPQGQNTLITRFTIPTSHRRKEYSFKCKVQQSPSRQWQSSLTGYIFGEPSVELFVVPRNPDSEPQTLQCYGTGFNPKIMWLAGSKEKNAVAQETTMQADGRVKVSSYVTVPLDEWKKGVEYTCKVNDFSTVWRSVSDCEVGEHLAQPPQQYLWGPSFTVMKSDGRAPLTCLVIAHKIKDFTITWRVENRVTSQDVIQESPIDHNNGSQSIQSVLMLSEQLWDKYDVSCEVKHRCIKKAQYVNISKIRDPKRPTVQVFKHSDSDFSDSHDSTLLCLITGFYPADISVHWELNGRKLPASRWNNSPLGSHSSGQEFSMHSALTLLESEREHGTFSCVVDHQSSQNPIISTVDSIHASVINSVPSVALMQAHDELVCLAYDYSPSAINITWLLDGVKVPHKHTTRPAKGPDGKFSVKSQLHALASEWAPGSKYTCLVQHVTGSSTQNISKEEIIEQNIYYNENLSDAIVEDTAEETLNMACAFIALFLLSLIYGCSVTLVKVNTARPARPFHSRDFK